MAVNLSPVPVPFNADESLRWLLIDARLLRVNPARLEAFLLGVNDICIAMNP